MDDNGLDEMSPRAAAAEPEKLTEGVHNNPPPVNGDDDKMDVDEDDLPAGNVKFNDDLGEDGMEEDAMSDASSEIEFDLEDYRGELDDDFFKDLDDAGWPVAPAKTGKIVVKETGAASSGVFGALAKGVPEPDAVDADDLFDESDEQGGELAYEMEERRLQMEKQEKERQIQKEREMD